MVDDLGYRLGHFRIPSFLVQRDPDVVSRAFSGMIVVRCEHLFPTGEFDYIAIHPDFDVVGNGQLPAEYECTFFSHPGSPSTHEWRKSDA